jgi:hypothetical protein
LPQLVDDLVLPAPCRVDRTKKALAVRVWNRSDRVFAVASAARRLDRTTADVGAPPVNRPFSALVISAIPSKCASCPVRHPPT